MLTIRGIEAFNVSIYGMAWIKLMLSFRLAGA